MISRVFRAILGDLLHGEHGSLRLQRAGLTIAANVVSKALGFAVVIYSTRVALEHLGPDRFGVWITISSISVLLGFLDLGVSNALIGKVAASSIHDDKGGADNALISAGFMALVGMGAAMAASLALVCFVLPWQAVFKGISAEVAGEARITGYVFAVLFGLSLPAQAVYKVYAGLQRGWVAHIATGAGWAVSLPLMWLAGHFGLPMWFYLLATFGLQQLGALALLHRIQRRGLIVWRRWSLESFSALRRDTLYTQARLFLVIQVSFAVIWGSNQIILSMMNGPTEAGAFGIVQRLFMVVQVALAVINAPLWAMYADARARGETSYIRSLLMRSMTATFIASLLGVGLIVAFRSPLLQMLAQGRISIEDSAVFLMAALTVLEATGNSFATYLNGVGTVRPQAITGVAYALVSVPAKIGATALWGLDGMLGVICLSYIVTSVIPYLTVFRRECLEAATKSLAASSTANRIA